MGAIGREEPCRGCGKSNYIQNKTHHLCQDCVYKKNHGGKSQFEVYSERQRAKKVVIKSTGERKVHLEIWDERPHFCQHCGVNLERFVDSKGRPIPHLFSHIKSKGSRPDLRLEKSNFELLCPDCHHRYEFVSRNFSF